MASVSGEQVAKYFGVTVARVTQLVREGMPRQGKGKYDLGECAAWYIRWLQAKLKGRPGGEEGAKLAESKERLVSIQAEREAMELEKLKGTMISVADAQKMWTDVLATVRARVNTIPAQSTPRIVGETNQLIIRGTIEKECNRALEAAVEDINALLSRGP